MVNNSPLENVVPVSTTTTAYPRLLTNWDDPCGRFLTREPALAGRLTRSLRKPTVIRTLLGLLPSGACRSTANCWIGIPGSLHVRTRQSSAQVSQVSPASRMPLPHGLGVA